MHVSDPWPLSDVLLLALPRQSEIASGRTGKKSKGEQGGGGGRQEADDGVSPLHLFSLKSLFLAQFHILSVFLVLVWESGSFFFLCIQSHLTIETDFN